MSEQKEPRRRFLRQVLAIVPASSLATGAAISQTGCSMPNDTKSVDSGKEQHPLANTSYKPAYFTAGEYAFLKAAVDHLIPSDEYGAGAIEADVPVFIDKQMETPYGHGQLWYMQGPFHPDQPPEMGYQLNLTPRQIFRLGIAEADAYANSVEGHAFAHLTKDQQLRVLKDIEAGKPQFDKVPAKTFFGFLLKTTKEGYFADPIYGGNKDMGGWKMVGFPGARADFLDWIDKPNVRYPYGPVSISGRKG
ncbi:gluconate 2-dehydrogenase [Robbsia andropogonis]|uniref:Gluconate 2-dehydrogenase n=1 Tax=Robbsia andropogonis TaxID=28092 RepID=A0A0F5JWY7_9BURK|nr:gluconate 2-dehydrogenase subunit 3 family protein [Robbsia andropogonis]KKB62134.1 gluconate 2-dehydrogenase [Robbsia andropogonis]MCP1119566.1 gluconate 2-dehydrogenase subunit 3 family protein [Robbsia andropogonis]MCP1129549.1 gluconate 2-dehydrogenase subunit 3 family protein [Robbsia andropogonis]